MVTAAGSEQRAGIAICSCGVYTTLATVVTTIATTDSESGDGTLWCCGRQGHQPLAHLGSMFLKAMGAETMANVYISMVLGYTEHTVFRTANDSNWWARAPHHPALHPIPLFSRNASDLREWAEAWSDAEWEHPYDYSKHFSVEPERWDSATWAETVGAHFNAVALGYHGRAWTVEEYEGMEAGALRMAREAGASMLEQAENQSLGSRNRTLPGTMGPLNFRHFTEELESFGQAARRTSRLFPMLPPLMSAPAGESEPETEGTVKATEYTMRMEVDASAAKEALGQMNENMLRERLRAEADKLSGVSDDWFDLLRYMLNSGVKPIKVRSLVDAYLYEQAERERDTIDEDRLFVNYQEVFVALMRDVMGGEKAMGKNTGIEWATHSFNPWWGCYTCATGCANCYAKVVSRRFLKKDIWGQTMERKLQTDKYWSKPLSWDRTAKGQRNDHPETTYVFCGSMCDIFEDHASIHWGRVLNEEREKLWNLIDATGALCWLLLTKRPGNIERMLPESWVLHDMPGNVWLGGSVATQKDMDAICGPLESLLERTGGRYFLSVEPMVGPVSLGQYEPDWVIIGGESGPAARKMNLTWAYDLIEECKAIDTPVFVKQLGTKRARAMGLKDAKGANPNEWPADLRLAMMPHHRLAHHQPLLWPARPPESRQEGDGLPDIDMISI